MHPADITAAIHKAGTTQVSLATKLGITDAAVNRIVRGHARSQRVERLVAQTVHLPLTTLWPQWYAATDRTEADCHARKAA